MTNAEASLILAVLPVADDCDYCDEPAVRKMIVEPLEAKFNDPWRDVIDVCEHHKYIGTLHNTPAWGLA